MPPDHCDVSHAVGDSLHRSIDHGLFRPHFGVAVISPHFLQKEWPQTELDGPVARKVGDTKLNVIPGQAVTNGTVGASRVALVAS